MSFRQRTSRTRNRRLSNVRQRRQQHLLDVKVRSRRAIQNRIRSAMGMVWKLALFVILCVAGYAGAREAVKRLFFENPDYRVQTIELQTDGTLQREQVLKAADLHEGANIFSVNLARMRDRIQELPQADEVEVVRKLPSEIDIRIVERKPVAWITSETEINDPFASDAAFLVGARGVLMKQKKLLPEYLGLPLIVGCRTERSKRENCRIARSKNCARLAASHREHLFANPLSDSRDRYLERLLSRRNRQKSQSRHVWFERSGRATAAAPSVP